MVAVEASYAGEPQSCHGWRQKCRCWPSSCWRKRSLGQTGGATKELWAKQLLALTNQLIAITASDIFGHQLNSPDFFCATTRRFGSNSFCVASCIFGASCDQAPEKYLSALAVLGAAKQSRSHFNQMFFGEPQCYSKKVSGS